MKRLYRVLTVLWVFALHFCSTVSIISLSSRITELEIIIMSFLPLVLIAAFQPIVSKKWGVSAREYYIIDFTVLGAMAIIGVFITLGLTGGYWMVGLIVSGVFWICLVVEVAIVGAVYGLIKLYQRGTIKGIIGTVALIALIAGGLHLMYISEKYYQIDSKYAEEVVIGSTVEEILKRYGEPDNQFPQKNQDEYNGTFSYEKEEYTYHITFVDGVAVNYKERYND